MLKHHVLLLITKWLLEFKTNLSNLKTSYKKILNTFKPIAWVVPLQVC